MSKNITPTEFPITIDGTKHWVKKSDYAKSLSQQLAITLKADIKRDHVAQMLDAILEKNMKELTGENPPELTKTFDKVLDDVAEARKEVTRRESEAEAAKLEEENKKKEAAEKEEKLFVAVKDNSADFQSLAKGFDTGENMDRFVPNEGTTDEELFAAFNSALSLSEFSAWMKGDLVVALEDRGHLNVCTKIAEERGIKFPSLYRMAATARAVPPANRKKGVSFTVYSEIANSKLDDDKTKNAAKKEKLFALADGGTLTTQTAREAVHKEQGKKPSAPVLPEDDEKRLFIVIDLGAETGQEIVTHTGFPKDLFAGGAIVIDQKTGKRFAENGFKKAAENRWLDLPVFAPPAPEPDPAPAATKTPAKKAAAKKK